MKALIFSMLFASSIASAAEIITLNRYSGHVIPSAALEQDCMLYEDNQVSGLFAVSYGIHQGRKENGAWETEIHGGSGPLHAKDLEQVNAWIVEAAAGPFIKTRNPCDIGTLQILTTEYALFDSKGCGYKVVNQHPSAQKLIDWMEKACRPDTKK